MFYANIGLALYRLKSGSSSAYYFRLLRHIISVIPGLTGALILIHNKCVTFLSKSVTKVHIRAATQGNQLKTLRRDIYIYFFISSSNSCIASDLVFSATSM